MKLKNKRTGEVKEVIVGGYPVSGKTKMWECSEVDANEETGYKKSWYVHISRRTERRVGRCTRRSRKSIGI